MQDPLCQPEPFFPRWSRVSDVMVHGGVTSGVPQGLTLRYHTDRTGILIKINNWCEEKNQTGNSI